MCFTLRKRANLCVKAVFLFGFQKTGIAMHYRRFSLVALFPVGLACCMYIYPFFDFLSVGR